MSATNRVLSAHDQKAQQDLLLALEVPGYRLLRIVGRGAMGVVFEAIDLTEQRRVALKMLHTQLANNQNLVARFDREAHAAALPQHPGVVKMLDVGKTADGISFIVMEYLDGTLLSQWLERYAAASAASARTDRVPAHAAQTLRIARQIAETLTAVHTKGVVHRDLKPDNIILVPDAAAPGGERVKICDFGIAKLLGNRGGAATEADPDLPPPLTAVGTIMGTPVYMSPEQWRGGTEITDRADVYAAGGIFYQLLVGHPPFDGTQIQLMLQHTRELPPPIREQAPWVPALLAELIDAMLAKAPHQRPSMQAVADSLALPQYQPEPRRTYTNPSSPVAAAGSSQSRQIRRLVAATADEQEVLDISTSPTCIIDRKQIGMAVPPKRRVLPEAAVASPRAPAPAPTPTPAPTPAPAPTATPSPSPLQESVFALPLPPSPLPPLPEAQPVPQCLQSSGPLLGVFWAWVVGILLTGMAALLLAPSRHP